MVITLIKCPLCGEVIARCHRNMIRFRIHDHYRDAHPEALKEIKEASQKLKEVKSKYKYQGWLS